MRASVINQELLDDVLKEAEFCFGQASRYLYKSKIRYQGEKQVSTDEAHFRNLLDWYCNPKDSQGEGQVLLYGPILYIQQWIYTLNEMGGREMLKSPSAEVLSTGA